MDKRELQLLKLCLQSEKDYLTSQELAEAMGVSDKTVRNLIRNINQQLAPHAQLRGLQGQGYHIAIAHASEFYDYYQKERERLETQHIDQLLDGQKEREEYFLYQLFFEEEVMAEELKERFYLSSSGWSKFLAAIRKKLSGYDLELKRKSGKLYIEGHERDKRRFIHDYFFRKQMNQPLLSRLEKILLFQDLPLQELYQVIMAICEEEGLRLSDYGLSNLLVHVGLAIKRMHMGYQVASLQLEDAFQHQRAESIALKIMATLAEKLEITLPREEATYIALHLLGKVQDNGEGQGIKETIHRQLIPALCRLKQRGYDIDEEDSMLVQGLVEHVVPLLLRLEHGIVLDNPLYPQIKEEYGDLLSDTEEVFSTLSFFASYQIAEQEWAYLLLHILAGIERRQHQGVTRVLLVCATGMGSAQLLQSRLINHFGHRIQISQVLSYHELGQADFDEVDVIVTSIDLKEQFFPKPVIPVNVFLPEKDIATLEASFGRISQPQETPAIYNKELESAFDACFSPKRFFVYEEKMTKEAVVEELVKSLSEDGEAFYQAFCHQLSLRELLGPVVFSPRVAVPHPAASLASTAEIAVAICKQGVEWGEESTTVQIVFLLSPSKFKNAEMRLITGQLARLIDGSESQQRLVEDPQLETLKQIICQV